MIYRGLVLKAVEYVIKSMVPGQSGRSVSELMGMPSILLGVDDDALQKSAPILPVELSDHSTFSPNSPLA